MSAFESPYTDKSSYAADLVKGPRLWSESLWAPLAVIFVALVVISAAPASWLSTAMLATREQLTPVVVPLSLLLYWSYRRSGWWANPIALSVTIGAFVLPVLGLWFSGIGTSAVAGGFLPWSDAGDYYYNAQRLLEGHPLTEFSARRVLFVGMLATLLEAGGRNLQLVLVAMAVITGIAGYIGARGLQRTHGPLAATILVVALFLYYRRIAGTTLTENLGFPLGVVAFAVLWNAAGRRSMPQGIWGLFLLAMALNARTGPFLVLPAVLVWLILAVGRKPTDWWRIAAPGTAAIAVSFLVVWALVKALGVPEAHALSDYPNTLYGIAVGGKRWFQIYIDHPEMAALTGPEFSRRALELAWEAVKANPAAPVVATLKAYLDFVVLRGPFHFIDPLPPGVENVAYRLALSGLSIWSFLRLTRLRQDPYASLILAAVLGVLASVPFVPPQDSDRLRIYAAAVPFFAAMIGVGCSLLSPAAAAQGEVPAAPSQTLPAIVAGVGLLALVAVGVLVPWSGTERVAATPTDCIGLDRVQVRLDRGAYVRLIPDSAANSTRVPDVRVRDFRTGMLAVPKLDSTYLQLIRGLSVAEPPALLTYTLDLRSGEPVWLLAPGSEPPVAGVPVEACGTFLADSVPRRFGVFRAASMRVLTPAGLR